MNLKLYPLDRQICSLRMASCKYYLYVSIHFNVDKLSYLSEAETDRWLTHDD